MALTTHRAERADALVEALADVLAEPQPDPLARELIAVPARGVERWVTQRLSHRLGGADGVCANVVFPSPTQLVTECVTAAAAISPDDDPWQPARLVWALLELIDTAAPTPRDRRFLVAQHVTRLFTTYGDQRPHMLRDWTAGKDSDGAGADLPVDLRWQAELWRRLRSAIDTPSRAERLEDICAALRHDPTLVDLPERVSVFGPTRLAAQQLQVLDALAQHRNVHLFLPHPSPALWEAVAGVDRTQSLRRRRDPTAVLARHPLLTSLGRDAREMQLLLSEVDAIDEHHLVEPPPDTLLGRIQRDIRADGAPEQTHLLAGDDRSFQVHACHGRARQVEVLREVLLGLLAADPTLEPRDVLVMCPDIDSYAPLVSATFGLSEGPATGNPAATHPGHRLHVRLADRSLRQTNPLLDVVARLLELADARVTASQVLDLVALPPLRRRFRLDDGDLERLAEWVSTSGVRWGLDAEHRAPYAMANVRQNTWQTGLDRLLLGVTMPEDDLRPLDLALPLDDVDSGDIDLAGRLAEVVDRLASVLDDLSGEHSLGHWLDTLAYALDALTEVNEADAWQLTQARRELGDVATVAGQRADLVSLALADVRALLADRLQGRPTRANFRTGNLTMCSMVPMRSVPHRVICLFGLDDGVFPRAAGIDGDDVLARDPMVGERDRRSEDRQLLLDAILAAEETLVMLYTGADERTGATRPPAVPLGELLDVVDATVQTRDARLGREHVVVRQPLQTFDPRNFEPGRLGPPGPFSHDRGALAGARAATRPRRAEPPLLASPLPAYEDADGVVPLDRLVHFLEHPVRGFFVHRLGITAPKDVEQIDDALHADLVGLDRWAVGDRWLTARLTGADTKTAEHAEWLRGSLPPGALGQAVLTEVINEAEPLVTASMADRSGEPESHDVSVTLPDGRVVAGTIDGVYGCTLARTVYSRLAPRFRIRAWVQLLALAAARPSEDWRAATIARGRKQGRPAQRSSLSPPPHSPGVLATLVALRDRGLRQPLPLPQEAAHEYASSLYVGDTEESSLRKAAKEWPDSFSGAKDEWHQRLWGDAAPFALVNEGTQFRDLARALWWPLLDAELLGAV
ncbi:MAG TPA: exodeoxyribonuclease V subunit gamma [Nocardioidaceae bacterium]|nr:exodeoxyribonuclease V subunit gamma [Nocardioidaceae bacterium]